MLRSSMKYVLFVLLTALVVPGSYAKQFSFDEKRVYAIDDDAELEINYYGGNIDVRSHDVNRVVIQLTKNVEAVGMDQARELSENIVVKIDQSRERLVVNTSYLEKINRTRSFWNKVLGTATSDPYGTVDFVVLVPRNCRVSISNNSGNVAVSNVSGAVAVRSSASDIRLNSVEGPVTVDNASGTTTGELLFGPVTINQPMGEIDLQWVEGDIKVKSGSAQIRIQQEQGAMDITTTTGSIDARTNLLSSQDFFIRTESGRVNLLVPDMSSGTLQIASELGNISTEMPVSIKSISRRELIGDFGDGGVKIHLSSTTGDVSVAQF